MSGESRITNSKVKVKIRISTMKTASVFCVFISYLAVLRPNMRQAHPPDLLLTFLTQKSVGFLYNIVRSRILAKSFL